MPPPDNQSGAPRIYTVGRWVYIPVNQDYRPKESDLKAQDYEIHGEAHSKNSDNETIVPCNDYQDTRLIIVRAYVCPEAAFRLPKVWLPS